MIRRRHPPSQSWRTFLRNHAEAIAAIDLCLVPTVHFERLFAFVIIGHGRRQLLWFAVTRHPTAEWLAQQIVEAFPWETAPTYLVRDNDGAYGPIFRRRVRAMGIRDRPISPKSPWQNPYAERLIGTLRRDCLDHVLILARDISGGSWPHIPLLQSDANARLVGQGYSARSINPATGSHHHCADLLRTASLLYADIIFRRDTMHRPSHCTMPRDIGCMPGWLVGSMVISDPPVGAACWKMAQASGRQIHGQFDAPGGARAQSAHRAPQLGCSRWMLNRPDA